MTKLDTTTLETALKAHEEHKLTFDDVIATNQNSEAINKWFVTLTELRHTAGKEFAKLTADRNSPDIYKDVTILFMLGFIDSVNNGDYK